MVVGCSHNSAGLKAVDYGAVCHIERISDNGKCSANKIIGRCPSYETPIKQGLKYFCMDYIVEERWPAFVDLTIEACNLDSSSVDGRCSPTLMHGSRRSTWRTTSR